MADERDHGGVRLASPITTDTPGAPEPRKDEASGKGKGKARVLCRFYEGKGGCRNGDACPFIHDPSRLKARQNQQGHSVPSAQSDPDVSKTKTSVDDQENKDAPPGTSIDPSRRRFNAPLVSKDKVVTKPIPTKDPRRFQIDQIKRRFSARETESTDSKATVLTFNFNPSDPDFPFDLPKGLQCTLHVPEGYGKDNGKLMDKPRLEVKNSEMNRGYQINVERGFSRLVDQSPQAGLLAWMKEFDKHLEDFLIEQKAEVVTIVPNFKTGGRIIPPKTQKPALETATVTPKLDETTKKQAAPPSKPSFTRAEVDEALARRQGGTSQLEARIGRLPAFRKTEGIDQTTYDVPIIPRKPSDLPVPLQNVQTIKLHVPSMYPLQHCRLELVGVGREAAKKTEFGFEKKARGDGKQMNLMGLINWFTQSMHVLATQSEANPVQDGDKEPTDTVEPLVKDQQEHAETGKGTDHLDDKRHIIVIPRPPEWDAALDEGDSSDSYDTGDEFSDEGDEDEDETELAPLPQEQNTSTGPERGVSLNFPQLELRGIELLELVSISITVKCERCKAPTDITNLRSSNSNNNDPSNSAKPRIEPCKKCALPLSISYRRDFLHANSQRAGYLDLTGCTPVDLLPSTFIPTCSQCSTAFPAPGIVSVRGPTPSTSNCRECHAHLSFTLPQLKFLLASTNPLLDAKSIFSARRPPKENLGITTGTELPNRGRCSHYSKSYRWFRFSCCAKVFPCDKCHDRASDHPNEHANRMICGFCSREQNYRPEDCGICRASVVKKTGRGFWEGGKGTRDRTKMSRKDPRKYKRGTGGKPSETKK